MRWELLMMMATVGISACLRTVEVGEGGSPYCTVENCRTLHDTCGALFVAESDPYGCQRLIEWYTLDEEEQEKEREYILSFCPAACNVQKAGNFVKCIVDNQEQCSAQDERERVFELCGNGPVNPDPDCYEACLRDREQCEEACPVGTFRECVECSARCGLKLGSCYQRCDSTSS